VSGLKPIPVILFVQALNGLILPFLVIFLLLVANDPHIMPRQFMPGWFYNLLLLGMLLGIAIISMNNIDKSLMASLGLPAGVHVPIVAIVSLAATLLTGAAIFRKRSTTGTLEHKE
jgi:Mn2+/Fe2+ NRAMP family transporter